MSKQGILVPEVIERRILLIRGQKVMLDFHLAELYGVETKALKRAVRRNLDRFPSDFCLKLSAEEVENLKYHFGTSSWGGRRYPPYAFTEQGVVMLSSVLNSKLLFGSTLRSCELLFDFGKSSQRTRTSLQSLRS